ncbi:InlB B-repeat-containing protein [Candidatus Saccharibacteria bacterium]|nr:InlB B-repeat-containing protein [Candidatus Saccharibacteria bacterium]
MEKQRRRDVRGIVGKIAAVVFAAGFVLSIVPAIRALAEGTIFKIQSAEITEISTGATGNINTYDEQTIVSNVTFHKINDSISYKIVLQNSDSKDHIIESITDDNASESINYVYDAHAGETVTAGDNLDFLLTAKYATAVTDTNKRAEVSNVKFFVKFTDVEEPEEIDIVVPDTNEEETPEAPENPETPEVPVEPNTDEDIPAVPDTGKNTAESNGTSISLATMIISVIGLTILAIIAVKKHKKYAKIIGVAVVAVSAFGLATTAKAANIETNSFTLTTNYGLYDKLVIKNGDDNVTINYGDKLEDAGEITNPEKPGYIFSGWQDEDGNDIDPTNPIYEDLTIKPKFTAISYKVRFNANGGAGEMADQIFTYDEAANLTTNAFTYTGRAYAGWDTEANGSGVHYDDAQSVKNLTTVDNGVVNLYAQWSINPYYINYNANGGEGEMATTNCEYDEDCQLRANAFTKYGYDFAGWKYGDQTFTDGQIVRNLIEQGTITLEAQWTPTEYEIHYDGITDEERFALNNPTAYTIETPAFQLRNPADRKDNDGDTVQVFVGWQETTTYPIIVLPNTNNLGTKTYLAIWNNVPFPRYSITYDLNNGNVTTANPTTHDKTESFMLNEPTKTGYTFTGWTGTTIEGDTPVMNYTLPAPHVRDNIEFTAHYRKNTYTINFDGNGSTSGSTASMNMNYDEAANLIANGFERTGYTFAGWKYNNEDYADGAEVTNLTAEDGGVVTMVAQWEPTQYTIIFHANNENVENPDAMAAQIVTYDIETPLTANAYTWWQHKIVEWTTNENGTGTKYADKAVIKNLDANGGEIHLYAKWREIDAALDGRGSMTNKGINTKLKAITTANPDAKNFLHYPNGEPSDEIKASATDLSGTIDPIYAWADGENIYWWSEDVKPRISTNNSVEYHYYGVGKSTAEGNVNNLEYMDLTGFDTTGIVGSRSPFEYTNIRRVDISDWDLSNATDMSYFAYHSNLEDIIFPEHFDIQKVTSLNMAFAGAKLKKLDFRG